MAQSGHRLVALHMSAFGGKADITLPKADMTAGNRAVPALKNGPLPVGPFEPLRCLVLSLGGGNEAARQKQVKTQRLKTLRQRNALKVGRKPPAADANEKIELLERRLNEALEQQTATSRCCGSSVARRLICRPYLIP